MRHAGRHHDGCPGPVRRVVRGLSARLGVPRSWVVAGFVVGLVFAPLLALLVFAASWFWIAHPARARAELERARRLARRVRRAWEGPPEAAPGHATQGPPFTPGSGSGAAAGGEPRPGIEEELAALRERLERAGERAEAMERYVTSEERALRQAFRGI